MRRAQSPPVVCIIGRKNSGKTTLLVRLVAALTERGLRVMTVKHGHGFDIDQPGTDSWRHLHEGGADRVVLASPDGVASFGSWGSGGEPPLADIVQRFLPDADLVVAEGFKFEDHPVIEVFRAAEHAKPLYDASDPACSRYIALVADRDIVAPVPVLRDNDPSLIDTLADLVEQRLLTGRASRNGDS